MMLYSFLVVSGLILIMIGRRILWLLVAAVGFLIGYGLSGLMIPPGAESVPLLIGLVVGLGFAFLARSFAKSLIGLAAFILMGGITIMTVNAFGFSGYFSSLVFFILGGLVGVGLVLFAFELSLIILSVLGGTVLIMQGLPGIVNVSSRELSFFIGIVLAVFGFLVQWKDWRRQ
jgi:hypothetical protein